MALPAATAWLIALMPWRSATLVLGTIGLVAAAAVVYLLPHPADAVPPAKDAQNGAPGAPLRDASRRGFPVLLLIGIIDTATRMGFLTFLPFLLKARGADLPTVGIALTLIFAGGAAGKLVCGYLGSRIGVIPTVFLTESLTAAGILALLPLPLTAGLAVLPVIGVALNGTSSVLYGTVPELVPPERRARAFGLFYTGAIGSGALSPALYGVVSNLADLPTMMALIAAVVLLTLPLAWLLRPALRYS
jgi:predicted MFS family arabinose efflux permease